MRRFLTRPWLLAILGNLAWAAEVAAYFRDRHTRHMVLGVACGAIGGWNSGTIMRQHVRRWLRRLCEIDWLSWICAAFAVGAFLVWLAGVMQ